jgi:hypothetical protein
MTRRIVKFSLACLMLHALTAQAIPLTYQFAAPAPNGYGFGYPSGGSPPAVPAHFTDFDWLASAQISGSFTIESEVVGLPSSRFLNGVLTEAGSFYRNPVTHLSLNIGDQSFEFLPTASPGAASPLQSFIHVADLPVPSNDPTTNYDGVDIDVLFGSGVLAGPFSHLEVSLSLVWTERDLSLISSRDMVENLVFSPDWHAFFSLYDRQLQSQYQIHSTLSSFTQVAASVPEPSSWVLFAAALGFAATAQRRRRPTGTRVI